MSVHLVCSPKASQPVQGCSETRAPVAQGPMLGWGSEAGAGRGLCSPRPRGSLQGASSRAGAGELQGVPVLSRSPRQERQMPGAAGVGGIHL